MGTNTAPTSPRSEQFYDEGGVCKLPSRPDHQRVLLRLEVVSSRGLKGIVAGLWAALVAGIILLVICAVYKQVLQPGATAPHTTTTGHATIVPTAHRPPAQHHHRSTCHCSHCHARNRLQPARCAACTRADLVRRPLHVVKTTATHHHVVVFHTHTYILRSRTCVRFASLAAAEVGVMSVAVIALLLANAWALTNPCAVAHPLLLWTMWLQWSCWITLCTLWCTAAHAVQLAHPMTAQGWLYLCDINS